jgi:ABC-type nitrate/sulfonate/bicarbonate transport system permease component
MTVFVQAPGSALRLLSRGAPILVLLAGWELATRSGLISTQVLPTFSSVFVAAVDLIASGTLGRHLAVSLYRALGGLALSMLIGVAL